MNQARFQMIIWREAPKKDFLHNLKLSFGAKRRKKAFETIPEETVYKIPIGIFLPQYSEDTKKLGKKKAGSNS